MNPKPLTPEQTEALHAADGQPLAVIDETTQHVYLVVAVDVHERAMKALHYQENVESIRLGAAGKDAGSGMSIDESQKRTEAAIQQQAAQ